MNIITSHPTERKLAERQIILWNEVNVRLSARWIQAHAASIITSHSILSQSSSNVATPIIPAINVIKSMRIMRLKCGRCANGTRQPFFAVSATMNGQFRSIWSANIRVQAAKLPLIQAAAIIIISILKSEQDRSTIIILDSTMRICSTSNL